METNLPYEEVTVSDVDDEVCLGTCTRLVPKQAKEKNIILGKIHVDDCAQHKFAKLHLSSPLKSLSLLSNVTVHFCSTTLEFPLIQVPLPFLYFLYLIESHHFHFHKNVY